MTHPPPSDRTPAAGVPPLYLTSTEVGETPRPQFHRNEPNFPPRPPTTNYELNYAKRTQSHPVSSSPRWPKASPDSSGNPISRNEPNFAPASCPNYAKRTQFPPRRTCGSQKLRNEPNLPQHHHHHEPENAKRTQFTPAPPSPRTRKCKTNPITTAGKPNPAKRTQFPATNQVIRENKGLRRQRAAGIEPA